MAQKISADDFGDKKGGVVKPVNFYTAPAPKIKDEIKPKDNKPSVKPKSIQKATKKVEQKKTGGKKTIHIENELMRRLKIYAIDKNISTQEALDQLLKQCLDAKKY